MVDGECVWLVLGRYCGVCGGRIIIKKVVGRSVMKREIGLVIKKGG